MDKFKQLELKRKKCSDFVYGGIATIAIAVLMLFIAVGTSIELLMFVFVVFLLAGMVLIIIGNVKFSKLQREFKNTYMGQIINDLIPGSTYQANMGIPLNDVYKSQLVKVADRSKTEDLIYGTIDGVDFKTCDLQLLERRVYTDSKGHQTVTYVPYFTGRYFIFDFNKNFKGNLIVTEASFSRPSGMKKIEMESEEFNDKFKVYTQDDHSAFYVLTPHLMVSLLQLEKDNPGCIMISMNSSKLYMAINNNRDTFNLKLGKKIDESLIGYFKRDVDVINNIVREMKLNNRIFKEED